MSGEKGKPGKMGETRAPSPPPSPSPPLQHLFPRTQAAPGRPARPKRRALDTTFLAPVEGRNRAADGVSRCDHPPAVTHHVIPLRYHVVLADCDAVGFKQSGYGFARCLTNVHQVYPCRFPFRAPKVEHFPLCFEASHAWVGLRGATSGTSGFCCTLIVEKGANSETKASIAKDDVRISAGLQIQCTRARAMNSLLHARLALAVALTVRFGVCSTFVSYPAYHFRVIKSRCWLSCCCTRYRRCRERRSQREACTRRA